MNIKSVKFINSNYNINYLPQDNKPEYAIMGRSNVGKSSLINMITNNKNVAKISKIPGKTKLINYFIINNTYYLVDFPGYGYAQTSKSKRNHWEHISKKYINSRNNLKSIILLLDIRIKPLNIDIEYINFLIYTKKPFIIVFTKIDKISKYNINFNVNLYIQKIKNICNYIPRFFLISSKNSLGRKLLLNYIDSTINIFC